MTDRCKKCGKQISVETFHDFEGMCSLCYGTVNYERFLKRKKEGKKESWISMPMKHFLDDLAAQKFAARESKRKRPPPPAFHILEIHSIIRMKIPKKNLTEEKWREIRGGLIKQIVTYGYVDNFTITEITEQ